MLTSGQAVARFYIPAYLVALSSGSKKESALITGWTLILLCGALPNCNTNVFSRWTACSVLCDLNAICTSCRSVELNNFEVTMCCCRTANKSSVWRIDLQIKVRNRLLGNGSRCMVGCCKRITLQPENRNASKRIVRSVYINGLRVREARSADINTPIVSGGSNESCIAGIDRARAFICFICV